MPTPEELEHLTPQQAIIVDRLRAAGIPVMVGAFPRRPAPSVRRSTHRAEGPVLSATVGPPGATLSLEVAGDGAQGRAGSGGGERAAGVAPGLRRDAGVPVRGERGDPEDGSGAE